MFFNKLPQHGSVHSAHAHHTVVVGGESGFVAAFGEGDRAEIAHHIALLRLFELREMGVSVDEYVVLERWAVLLVVYVSVCEEETLCAVYDEGIVCHYRELEQHLVYLCVAIAAHGYDVVFASVKQFDDAFRVDAFGYAVARSVVEYVARECRACRSVRGRRS